MKKDTSAPKRTITTLPILPGTLVVCGCTLAAFMLIFLLMSAGGLITLPPALAALFDAHEGNAEDDGFPSAFLSSLSGVAPDMHAANEALLTMDDGALKDLLLSSEPPDTYYQLLDVTWTDGIRFRRAQVYYIVSGERIHAEILPIDGPTKYLTSDGTQLWVREAGNTRLLPHTDSPTLTLESECGIPSLTRIKEMIRNAEIGKYELTLETVMDSPCIRLRFTDPLTGIREIFDVLPDRGLIASAYAMLPDSDITYYQMTTTAILTDLTALDETIFEIPKMEKSD